MRKRIVTIAIATVVGLISGLPVFGEELEVQLVQVRHRRLYFDRGEEDRILRYSRFVAMHNGELVFEGCIEASLLGISYSYPISVDADSLLSDSLTYLLNPAPIDSVTTIRVGYCGPIDLLTGGLSPEQTIYNELNYREYDSDFEMNLDFEAGRLDVVLAYRDLRPTISSRTMVGTEAPFYVALVPNVSRPQRDRGLITASMYYRFDPERMSLVFAGHDAQPFNCLTIKKQACLRPYPYDPEQGRLLLKQLRPRPKTLSLGTSHDVFKAALYYYADILSRERIRITVDSDWSSADIRLLPVPLVQGDALTSLEFLQRLLTKETTPENDVSETLQIIGDYLSSARLTRDSTVATYYGRLAETSLRDDLGILPLYRPTVYVTTRESIIDLRTDGSGVICIEDLVKIIPPQPGDTECGP